MRSRTCTTRSFSCRRSDAARRTSNLAHAGEPGQSSGGSGSRHQGQQVTMLSRLAGFERPRLRRPAGYPRTGRLGASERRAGILFSLPVVVLTGALLFLPILPTFYYSLAEGNRSEGGR